MLKFKKVNAYKFNQPKFVNNKVSFFNEKQTITIMPINIEIFKQFNNQNEEIVEAAKYKIMIGASSRDLKLKGVIVVR